MSNQLLLEIGTEEIPARFMRPALAALEKGAREKFAEHNLDCGDMRVMGTPRRLVLMVADMADRQKDIATERTGPSVKVAFSDDGTPTKAAAGFARSCGVPLEQLKRKKTEKGEYLHAKIIREGKPVKDLLSELLPQIITSLPFPKSMRWEASRLTFARPIRWLIALLGGDVVDFELSGLRTGRETPGHRTLAPGPFEVKDASEYTAIMKKAHVVVDHRERKENILKQIRGFEKELNARALVTEELLDEVTHLVEYPTALCGEFSDRYLSIPPEVLMAAITGQQKYFPVADAEGKLLPRFINIINGNPSHLPLIRSGNEKVLKARLEDAKYFYEEDLKVPLEENVERLHGVLFIKKIGTVYEKMERMLGWAKIIGDTMGLAEDEKERVKRAVRLAKADLVTNMVEEKDFTKLQGAMGRIYALESGEDPVVAQAIEEHYRPRYAGDALPSSKTGMIVSLADRLDTIVACFALDLVPTGSQDPFALRRNTIGILRILIEKEIFLDIDPILTSGVTLLPENLREDPDTLHENVGSFIRQRLRTLLEDEGIRFEIIDSLLAAPTLDPLAMLLKARTLASLRTDPVFAPLVTGARRVFNILKSAGGEIHDAPDPALFEDEAERALYGKSSDLGAPYDRALGSRRYEDALKLLFELKEPVDEFFDRVMVMVDDERLRLNRLRLLNRVKAVFLRFTDFSRLSAEG